MNAHTRNAFRVVIYGSLILVAWLVVAPLFVRARTVGSRVSCWFNLSQINSATMYWASQQQPAPKGSPTWDDLASRLEHTGPLLCPQGGVYTLGTANTPPTCTLPDHHL